MSDQALDEVVIVADDGTEHVFPSGFDPKRAAEIVKANAAALPPETPAPEGRDWADALPAVGGFVGGMLGGSKFLPTGMGGAALGGGAGEAARILIRAAQGRGKDIPGMQADSALGAMGESAMSIGRQALTQAASEGIGRGITGALAPVGRAMYGKLALRPIQSVMDKYGYKAVRDLGYAEKAIAGSPKHARINLEKLRSGVGTTKRIEQAYDAAGKPVLDTASALDAPLTKLAAKSARQGATVPGAVDESAKILAERQRIVSATPTMPAAKMGQALRDTDEVSSAAYDAARRTGRPTANPGDIGVIAKEAGTGYRTKLRQALHDTTWEAQKNENATRYGLQRALERSIDRPEHLTTLMAGSLAVAGNPAGALGMRMAALPAVASAGAIYAPRVAGQAPRLFDIAAGGAVSDTGADLVRNAIMNAMATGSETP